MNTEEYKKKLKAELQKLREEYLRAVDKSDSLRISLMIQARKDLLEKLGVAVG